MSDKINLVDKNGNRIGAIDKMEAHVKGQLREAFSIFIFNSKNQLLTQQRARDKYHSGGLWSNTVCSHTEFGEELNQAASRRLKEEMGLVIAIKEVFSFVYRSDYKNGLSEHEFDHVFVGYGDSEPYPDQNEVMDYKWVDMLDLKQAVENHPDNYTTWFKKILESKEFEKIPMNPKSRFVNKATNIIGQIRLYSLVDLALFTYVIGANTIEAAGIVLLHISFLFYLEYTHKHTYRLPIPKYLWIIAGIIGAILYAKLAVIGFIVASMLYVRKHRPPFSYLAPLARGCQYYFFAAGILGWASPIPFLALALMATRNFCGDLRDITKDKKENMKTLPIVLGLDRDYKKIYLGALFLVSFIWWRISGLVAPWLLGIYLIQILTYRLTPRE